MIKKIFSFKYALIIFLCFYFLYSAVGADFYWYLINGRLYSENKSLCVENTVSFSAPLAIPSNEWLSAVSYYFFYELGGGAAALFLKSLILTLCFVSLIKFNLFSLAFFVLANLFIKDLLAARAEYFTLLFFILSFKAINKKKYFLMPFFIFLAANFHIGFVLIFFLFFIKFFIFLVEKNKNAFKKLFLWFLISIGASFLNPAGINIYGNFYFIMFKAYSEYIDIFRPLVLSLNHLRFILLTLLAVITVFNLIRAKKFFLCLVICFLTALSLISVRYFLYLIPFLTLAFNDFNVKFKTALLIIFLGTAVFIPVRFREPSYILKDAAEFLKERESGNIFNDYLSGSYLGWELYGKHKIFIDGRNHIYSKNETLADYIKFTGNKIYLKNIIEKYGINYIILSKKEMFYLKNTELIFEGRFYNVFKVKT